MGIDIMSTGNEHVVMIQFMYNAPLSTATYPDGKDGMDYSTVLRPFDV